MSSPHEESNRVQPLTVLFIPEHIHSAMLSKKITLSDLGNRLNDVYTNNKHQIQIPKHINDKSATTTPANYGATSFFNTTAYTVILLEEYLRICLGNDLSSLDISDLYDMNYLLHSKLLPKTFEYIKYYSELPIFTTRSRDKIRAGNYNGIIKNDDRMYNDLITAYSNNSKDLDIIMNGDKLNSIYKFEKTDTCLFVILYDGFTNFITLGNREFKYYFLKDLTDYMFKMCGETKTLNSVYFRDYVYSRLDKIK